ncbi:MAG: serine/threonine protein kinase [Labilithrix sp.]|nr:serine/threonine protein kinase [Labilithrix sp.]
MKRIGGGAMGEVWSATDRATGDDVAVKMAQGWAATEPELVERFEREAKLLARIKSPFICSLVDAGRTDDDLPFMVLERLSGETLEQHLEREGYLALDEAGRIADEMLQALVVAHAAGVVHRDLSPANVFLHRTRDGKTITKVLDFGVAKVLDASAPRTGARATMGTLPYVAPEQLGDSARAGPRADLYAVGTLVFRAVTGRMPYGDAQGTALVVLKREHDPPSIDEATGERWPAALRTFLTKTMARSPSKRYASAEIALAALREAVHGKGPALAIPEKALDATTTLTGRDRRSRKSRMT